MKFVIVVLILMLLYLFYPFHDLYVKEDPFSASYDLVAKGFWSQDSCAEAAEAQQASDYLCRKHTTFVWMFRSASEFNQIHGTQE